MIDVALRPADARPADLAIVIDVLRATSTLTQALAAGYRGVLCVQCTERAETLRGAGRVLAGERSCVKPPGFDQGNSPIEARRCSGDELVLATTNGTPAILVACANADTVLLACMLNLDAVVRAALGYMTAGKRDVHIVCAGTNGAVSLEDAYVAGRISSQLPGARTDAALVAEGVARAFVAPLEALSASADARALDAAQMSDDVAYCAQESLLALVPAVASFHSGVAVVTSRCEDSARPRDRRFVEHLDPVSR